jgi:gluconokinase
MTPPADAPLVLTLDIGTSSARALIFDRNARPLEGLGARRTHSVTSTPDGGAELEAGFLLRQVEETLDEVLAKAGSRASSIGAVACCTFWHSVMGVDEAGLPLTPVYTWGDTRAEPQKDELRRRMDEKAYHARTGAFFHPLYWPEKLLWLRAHPNHGRVRSWLSFGEFLFRRLFGRSLCSVSMASGTGLLDTNACGWDAETLSAVGVAPEQLGSLGDVMDAFTGLRDPYARRWPALRDLPWTPPVGDGACSNLGSGCATPERITVMIGTSGAMRVAWTADRVEIPWGLWCYRADRRRVLLGGALNDGGNLVEWCRRTFQLGAPDEVEREIAAMEPDAHGLTFLPFLAGERSPNWIAHARAAISGLSLATKPAQILRAGMEAVALRFALIHEMLRSALPQAREIVASGGALLNSPAWTRILADAMGRPILPSAEPEASSRGAALLTLEALGMIPRLEELPAAFGAAIPSDSARHARYVSALARQKEQYAMLVRP